MGNGAAKVVFDIQRAKSEINMIHKNHSSSIESIISERSFQCVCVCLHGKANEWIRERKKESSARRKESRFFSFFINYVDLSWPIEILIGLFEYECVQCTQCIRACMKMTEHIHLNILPPHLWFDTTSTHSALLLHQYVSFAHFILLDYRYACCVFISFRFVSFARIYALVKLPVPSSQ